MKPFRLMLRLTTKRDVVLARQRTRQLAGLLGFGPGEQVCLAAGTFALATEGHVAGRAVLCLEVQAAVLSIFIRFEDRGHHDLRMRIEKPLPERGALAAEDLDWAMAELSRRTPLNVFEEMTRLNQELLSALLAVPRRSHPAPAPWRQEAAA